MIKYRLTVFAVVILAVVAVLLAKNLLKETELESDPTLQAEQKTISFISEGFIEADEEAREKGLYSLIVFSEKPFCVCFGDKDIAPGYTLNTYNSQVTALLSYIGGQYDESLETILIDRNGLNASDLNLYLEFRETLGVNSVPALVLRNPAGDIELYVEGAINREEVERQIQNLIEQDSRAQSPSNQEI